MYLNLRTDQLLPKFYIFNNNVTIASPFSTDFFLDCITSYYRIKFQRKYIKSQYLLAKKCM